MYNRNGYFGNYSPYYQQSYMSYQQPQMQMQQTQPSVPFSDVRYGTLDEAKAHIVMPGGSVMFIDRNLGEFYVKSANQMGEPALEEFEFKKKEINKKDAKVENQEFVKFDDIKDFVKKEDFNGISERFDKLEGLVKILTKGDKENDKH